MRNKVIKVMDTKDKIESCTYPVGTIGHYMHHVKEHERVKELADNSTGNLANELYMELDRITMILEDYLP